MTGAGELRLKIHGHAWTQGQDTVHGMNAMTGK
jgi:hypothetical protein